MTGRQRWGEEDKQLLQKLYVEDKLPIAQIVVRLGRSPASVNQALSNFVVRKRCIPKLRMPTSMTPALARIHAHVCGDGHLFVSRERDHYGYLSAYKQGRYRHRYGFGYTNLNMDLIHAFMKDVRNVFGLTPRYRPKDGAVTVRSKAAWELLKHLGAGKSRTWWIHPDILQADDDVAIAWPTTVLCFVQ
jgi:hypothetical protein